MNRPRLVMSRSQRDAMRHMIFAGIRPRDIVPALELRSSKQVVLRPRRRAAIAGVRP